MAGESEPGEKASAEEQAIEHVKAFFLDLAAKGKDLERMAARSGQ